MLQDFYMVLHLYVVLRVVKFTESESRIVVGGRAAWGLTVSWVQRFSLGGWESSEGEW